MSMKISNDTIGNGTSDLPVCSAVSQPTAPPLIPLIQRAKYIIGRGVHPGARSSGRLNFVPSRLILRASAYGKLPCVNFMALRILRQLFN